MIPTSLNVYYVGLILDMQDEQENLAAEPARLFYQIFPYRCQTQKPSGVWESVLSVVRAGQQAEGVFNDSFALCLFSASSTLSPAPLGDLGVSLDKPLVAMAGMTEPFKQLYADTVGGFDPATKDGERMAAIPLLLTSTKRRKAVSPIGCP